MKGLKEKKSMYQNKKNHSRCISTGFHTTNSTASVAITRSTEEIATFYIQFLFKVWRSVLNAMT
jgi:hypothetical protein